MPQTFTKDPDATLDYTVDWTAWMASGDSISTSTWIVPSGLTQISDSKTETKATVWLSGGTTGQSYTVTNRIVTAAGRTEDRSITVKVLQR